MTVPNRAGRDRRRSIYYSPGESDRRHYRDRRAVGESCDSGQDEFQARGYSRTTTWLRLAGGRRLAVGALIAAGVVLLFIR